MLQASLGPDIDVIDIIFEFLLYHIHTKEMQGSLVSCVAIVQAKGHNCAAKNTHMSIECCLLVVF